MNSKPVYEHSPHRLNVNLLDLASINFKPEESLILSCPIHSLQDVQQELSLERTLFNIGEVQRDALNPLEENIK